MTFPQSELFIAFAAFLAGALNAGAGGGSFISFPALLATGVAPVSANATNNVAMWLGALASTRALTSGIDVPRKTLVRMTVISVAGSMAGALLLLATPNTTFAGLIPILLLVATVVFVAGPWLTAAAQRSRLALSLDSPFGLAAQFIIAAYGGFFGAAIGILILALLGLFGMHDLRRANAFKMVLTTLINGVAVVPFVAARVIAWEPAVAMSAGAMAGGFFGARLVQRLPSRTIRGLVIAVTCTMTTYFFWKTYWR